MPTDEQSPWRTVLPLVIEAAADSAKATSAATEALSGFEARLASLESTVSTCNEKLATFIALEESDQKRKKAEADSKNALVKSILTPQFLTYLVTLLLALAGFRISMPEEVVQSPTVLVEETP